MIWYSTNYFNQEWVDKIGISEKQYETLTTYQAFAVILGVTHTLGESDDRAETQAWLDKWVLDGEEANKSEGVNAK